MIEVAVLLHELVQKALEGPEVVLPVVLHGEKAKDQLLIAKALVPLAKHGAPVRVVVERGDQLVEWSVVETSTDFLTGQNLSTRVQALEHVVDRAVIVARDVLAHHGCVDDRVVQVAAILHLERLDCASVVAILDTLQLELTS